MYTHSTCVFFYVRTRAKAQKLHHHINEVDTKGQTNGVDTVLSVLIDLAKHEVLKTQSRGLARPTKAVQLDR